MKPSNYQAIAMGICVALLAPSLSAGASAPVRWDDPLAPAEDYRLTGEVVEIVRPQGGSAQCDLEGRLPDVRFS